MVLPSKVTGACAWAGAARPTTITAAIAAFAREHEFPFFMNLPWRFIPASAIEIRRVLHLLQVGSDMLVDRHIDEGDPACGPFCRFQIEMLVLHAAGRHRQQDKIAFAPVLALAVDDR